MLMAATGAGKSYLGLRVIHEALKKGKRAIFVCDRRSLIEQTSAVADSYGLSAHGVLMANHNRYDLRMPFQVASAQTLARRQWPAADVIVIDEAHTQLKVWTEHIQNTDAAVIGLSATPFSTGLGRLFTNLVNATSMHHLTESGVLVPMRVFSCAKVDMRGAETSGGEWTDRAAQERGMAIVGDVVTEWSKFASDRKTIVFGATIAHCEEMARQFNDSGVMAACFTSDTDQAERDMLLSEYRKPDSALRVLISVEALAKGFDVPDVSCVCDVRPLRKSLSTAIQMWGRGLRCSPATDKQDCYLLDFSGNIGSFRRMEYAVMGDPVNLAARLQELSKTLSVDIVIDGTTKSKIPASYAVRDSGVKNVRGRHGEVEAWILS
jgi:superfamily II DNA or RNA helicase